ncbi:hypothetical protein RE6C_05814 [Rhodopirellula europaea 6C]|uniref:Uncharacterized protein n=1 Tax=Rhodopirellula europaea 6C TaxID=1263867 RepID=M2A3B5_9BACT|nr:hypothetical protein RE6C_05814 [Rhodopirellula europaea 6C]
MAVYGQHDRLPAIESAIALPRPHRGDFKDAGDGVLPAIDSLV